MRATALAEMEEKRSVCSYLQIYILLVSQRQAKPRKHIPTIPTVRRKATTMNVHILERVACKAEMRCRILNMNSSVFS